MPAVPLTVVDVLLPIAVPVVYTWSVPPHLVDQIFIGCRVDVNLGTKKRYAGLVKKIYKSSESSSRYKPILQVLDEDPIVSSTHLKFWDWVASYYVCTQGEVMAAALPANFRLSSEAELIWNEQAPTDFTHLNADQYLVAEALLLRKKLQISEVQALLDRHKIYPVVNMLLKQGYCYINELLVERYKPKQVNYLCWTAAYNTTQEVEELVNNWKGTSRQLALLLEYIHSTKDGAKVTPQQLIQQSGIGASVLKALVDKGILCVQAEVVNRLATLPPTCTIDFTLSSAQQKAYAAIQACFATQKICLLHGVTSSGKTNIYIQLIATVLTQQKQVLYLLPEIALTTQLIQRLQHHFGGNVGVYHSKFSGQERVELWNRVLRGEIKIIVGARSAVFLPFISLGLVIVDEEHDASFKQQDPSPRYHGRNTAVYLATLFKANVLLGSATPSLETYHHACVGKYGLVTLSQRYGEVPPPVINLVDKPVADRTGKEVSMLSDPLHQAITKALANKRQVILFQNRRGYVPYQVCVQCGWVPRCLQCDVSLTYHKQEGHLLCHYCGNRYQLVQRCGTCGKGKFTQKSFGTEMIEEKLATLFPNARIARMDIDTVSGKYAHDKLIRQFEQGAIDILVGTQMVVKGLDVDRVDVVGVLDADGLLRFSDFRVLERAFQLIEQVSGRAGRRAKVGKVFVQTADPSLPLFKLVQQHDFVHFFKAELENRKTFFYPPYSRLIALSIRHVDESIARAAARFLAEKLGPDYKKNMMGPAPAIIFRVRNQYRMELLLKLPARTSVLVHCKQAIQQSILALRQQKKFNRVYVSIDVDPA